MKKSYAINNEDIYAYLALRIYMGILTIANIIPKAIKREK